MKKVILLVLFSLGIIGCSSTPHPSNDKNSRTSPQFKDTLKVMTYNIHHGNPPSKAKKGTIDLKAIAKVINEQKPDLVALQEVDVNNTRSGRHLNEAKELGQLTGMHYYFSKAMDYKKGEYGNAVLSRFPIQDSMRFELPIHKKTQAETRVVSMIEVTLNNKNKLYFASTHLGLNRDNRLLQVKKISAIIQSISSPIIIAGDFNSLPDSPTMALLDSSLTRSCLKKCSASIPSDSPARKIDYIMYRPAGWLRVGQERVIPNNRASDHRPVVVTFHI